MSTFNLVPPKEPGTQKRGKLHSLFFIPSSRYVKNNSRKEVTLEDIPLQKDVIETVLPSPDEVYSNEKSSTQEITNKNISEQDNESLEEQEFREEMQAQISEEKEEEKPEGPLEVKLEKQEPPAPEPHPDFPVSGIRFAGEENKRAEEHLAKPVTDFKKEIKIKTKKTSDNSQWTVAGDDI